MGKLPQNKEVIVLSEEDLQYVDYVISYVQNSSNDWFLIKKEIMNCYPPKLRKKFSRRHYSTKLFFVNDFEKLIINYWKEKTNIELFIDEKKLHPSSWKRNPKGWGLFIYNEKRKTNKRAKKIN
jgi:hypothetical protein